MTVLARAIRRALAEQAARWVLLRAAEVVRDAMTRREEAEQNATVHTEGEGRVGSLA